MSDAMLIMSVPYLLGGICALCLLTAALITKDIDKPKRLPRKLRRAIKRADAGKTVKRPDIA